MIALPKVSTHASVRRRHGDIIRSHGFQRVSTHASVRRRLFSMIFPLPHARVSTHASVRRRPCAQIPHSRTRWSFNSRLREEATPGFWYAPCAYWGFNSRLREEATALHQTAGATSRVSTHASVRRRPGDRHLGALPAAVSTHASVRRRLVRLQQFAGGHEFQLTPP